MERVLQQWGRRLRWVEGVAWGAWGAVGGLASATALAVAARLWPLLPSRSLVTAALLGPAAGGLVGMVAALARPWPRHRLARVLDRRLGLAERLTTAVEIAEGRLRTPPAMAAAQRAEMLEAVARVDIRTGLPIRLPRRAPAVLGALALMLGLLLWLPNPQEAVLAQRAAVRAAVGEQIETLEAQREKVERAEGLTEADREAILRALEEALASLEEDRASPEEAVAALAEAERQLAPLQDPGAATVREGLRRATGVLADSDLTRDLAEALAQGDYRAAAQALVSYAGSEGEPLTREEELDLARQLAEAAQVLAGADPDLARQLDEAARALERGDIRDAQEAIQRAAQRLAEAGARVQRQEAVEQTLAALQEGREEIAQAAGGQGAQGARAQRGEGQGTQGAGAQGGQGAGAQNAEGRSTGGEEAGQQTSPGHHEDAGTGAPYDEVFVPYRLEGEGAEVELGREGEGGLPQDRRPLPAAPGRATIPYREVYADYAAQAHAALEGSYIPLGMKQYVRDYFAALEP